MTFFEFAPSATEILFWDALALMVAACLFAPLFRYLGLGTILGYLAAGLAVQLLFRDSLAEHPEEILHFAEFGVVLFLFVIGLELKASHLWAMRRDIFGLGLSQMLVSGAVLALASYLLGLGLAASIVTGFGLALSSTAIALRMLDERGDRNKLYGRKTFSILLFQDLAIVPLLLLVGLLAPRGGEFDLVGSLVHIAVALLAIVLLVAASRYLLNPVFRLLARAQMPEIMTASALALVIGAALLMDLVGLSYAMGAFIAGVMLAESAYRHEIEANIEPFRGLFLGLFFMAVGLALDLNAVLANWPLILLCTPVVMAMKAGLHFGVARGFGVMDKSALRVGLVTSQAGEFGFVLFAAAAASGVLNAADASVLIAVVTLSMALSPLTGLLERWLITGTPPEQIEEDYTDTKGRVLIIGFGRFGQIVCQPLFAHGTDITILDSNAVRVRDAERFGFRVHFGDGSRRDVLRAAGTARVELVCVCVNGQETTDRIVALVQREFPEAELIVRSYDRRHSIDLARAGIRHRIRETFESALRMGERALVRLEADEDVARAIMADVRARDRARLREQIDGDLSSGRDHIHTSPVVRPEPLK